MVTSTISLSQSFDVSLSPVTISGLGGLQSYAVGTYDGDWLLVGGRLDGLHRRQPFASFNAEGKNQDLIVVDPEEGTVWRAPLTSLPTSVAEQLSATNMQFYQSGDQLLCTGGYAFSPTVGDHITFPYLTIIDLPQTINAVKGNSLDASTFHQIENEAFRVTGGGLNKIDDIYYLVGGHKFMGRYNPVGPEHGPGFEQEYTNEIRKFKIIEGDNISVEILDVSHDELHLHRRDYNLVPYLADGERELMIYSGVFQTNADLPYLYPVSIDKDGYEAKEDFAQYFNHYHCAYLPIYDQESDDMHTIFFGGIAQFYEENGGLVQDNDVPFVNTIADVSRNAFGDLNETILSTTMPGYLGAGSIFIIDPKTELVEDDIIDGSKIGTDFQSIGYIYGGIRSSMPNIFWVNTGEESEASQTIYKVSIRRVAEINSIVNNEERDHLQFYPNPARQEVRMSIDIDQPTDFSITITDVKGGKIHTQVIKKETVVSGRNILVLDEVNVGYGAFYYTIQMGDKKVTRKVIWSE